VKSNKEMTEQEFSFTIALRRAVNDMNYVIHEIEMAKNVAPQGLSTGAILNAEAKAAELKLLLYQALKTV
jgi:hypothetical protein